MTAIKVSPEEQLAEIKLGCAEIISEEELLTKLTESYNKQRPLIAKLGADPSRPDIHLGHTVVLNKLKLLQDFGHTIKFIIGDFTALIGDPTGRSKTRPQLTEAEVLANAQTYQEQVFKVLDPAKTDVVFNSNWLNQIKPMDFIRLMATRTVQQLIARDDFATRYSEQTPIFLHEFVYPIMQAYDSVHLKADIELGGTDQKFNLLLGRELQRQQGQRPQSVLLTPLLEGLDGVQKMSKSLDNYIGLTDAPEDMFGKTMSVSDTHMLRFYELLSRKGAAHIAAVKAGLADGSLHPMEAKKAIAEEIVAQYWGSVKGGEARHHFETVFSRRDLPDDLSLKTVATDGDGRLNLLDLLVELGYSKSKGEARRVLKQNGLKIDGEVVSNEWLALEANREYVLRCGKLKMLKIKRAS